VCLEEFANDLDGVYYRTGGTDKKRFKMPIYHKADGSDLWIEYDASKLAWRIKSGVHKGTCFASEQETSLEACTLGSWYVFNGAQAPKLRQQASCYSKFAYGQLVRIQGLQQARGFYHI
jgi:hypothetical protein